MRFARSAPVSSDRRSERRYEIRAWGRAWAVADASRVAWGFTHDVSRSGLALIGDQECVGGFTSGEWVRFEFRMPVALKAGTKLVFEGAGTCVRIDEMAGAEKHASLVLLIRTARLTRHEPAGAAKPAADDTPRLVLGSRR